MKRTFRFLPILAGAFLFLNGCGHKGGGSLNAKDEASFDQASPEIKQMWTKASEASKADDYVTAYNLYYALTSQDLSPEQKAAVSKANTALNDRLLDAVGKGDPAAQKALDEMHRNPPNRQPH